MRSEKLKRNETTITETRKKPKQEKTRKQVQISVNTPHKTKLIVL